MAIRTIIALTNKTIFKSATAVPPIDVTLVIFSNPLDAVKVTNIIQIIPNTPKTWVEFNPKNAQVEVVSLPKIAFEIGIHSVEQMLTIQII